MKKSVLIIIGMLFPLLIMGKSMYVYQGNVVTMVTDATAGTMAYTSTTLTIQDYTFQLNEVDSIVFNDQSVQTDSVIVTYNGSSAKVYIPLEVRSYLTATIDGAHVTIASSQTEGTEVIYSLSGTSSNGSFTQDGSYKCTVRFDGLSLTSTKGAAVDIDNGKRIDVIVADGTTNTLTDCAGGTQKACFRVKGHAEFKGGGTLNIASNTTHAYKSGEYTQLKKSFGTLNITSSANDALHVGQYFQMNGGTVNIANTAGDGIQVEYTSDATDELNGQMILNGGSLTMTLSGNGVSGLKSDSILSVTGGTYHITMNGSGAKGINVHSADISDTNTTPTLTLYANGGSYTVSSTDKKKSYCMKTDNDLYIHAGTINAYPTHTDAKGIKVGGDYYYTVAAKINVTPSVSGTTFIKTK